MAVSSKSKLFLAFKIFVAISLLFIVIQKIDFSNLRNSLIYVSFIDFFLFPLFACMHSLVDVLIKNEMFDIFKFKIKKLKLFKELLKGLFWGFFMPSMVGGDAYYIYRFGKGFNNYYKITAGIVLIKTIGLSVFFVLAVTMLLMHVELLRNLPNINIDVSIIIIILLLIIISISLLIIFRRQIKLRFRSFMEGLKQIRNDILNNKKNLLRIILFSVLFYSISIGTRLTLALLIGIELPISQIIGIILIVNFLVLLPITISGIGIREISYIGLLGLLGIDSEQAFLMSLYDFMISISGVLIGGLLVLYDNFLVKTKLEHNKLEQNRIKNI